MNPTVDDIRLVLEQEFGLVAALEERDGDLVVSGMVDTQGEHDAVLDIVTSMAPDMQVVDDLEVLTVLPEEIGGLQLAEVAVGDFPGAEPGTEDDEALEPGDFTDQQILDDPLHAAGASGVDVDETQIGEGEEVYVPPTDPVRDREGEFIGGFQTTSMDSVQVPPSALDGEPGDEAIAETILRELREDAATTDLDVQVAVDQGVAHLRGTVPTLLDAENVEEVAFRVEGVVDVIDRLKIEDLA
jgi:osmotically-inducible protein OsmY